MQCCRITKDCNWWWIYVFDNIKIADYAIQKAIAVKRFSRKHEWYDIELVWSTMLSNCQNEIKLFLK